MKKNKKKKIYFKELKNFCGLEYLTLKNCPMYKDDEFGEVIELTAKQMEVLAAVQIVINMIPFRGLEVSILRNAMGLSYENFARLFNLSAATVFKWEKARYDYVSLPNDLMLRMMASEKFNCKIPSKFSEMKKVTSPEKPIVFKFAS